MKEEIKLNPAPKKNESDKDHSQNPLITRPRSGSPQNMIMKALFLVLCQLISKSLSIWTPEKKYFREQKFIKIRNEIIQNDPKLFSIAITESGSIYKVTTAPFNVRRIEVYNSVGSIDTGFMVKNAMFVSEDHVLALTKNQDILHYQLLKIRKPSYEMFDPLGHISSSKRGSMGDTTDFGAYDLASYQINKEGDRIIAIFNGNAKLVGFRGKTAELVDLQGSTNLTHYWHHIKNGYFFTFNNNEQNEERLYLMMGFIQKRNKEESWCMARVKISQSKDPLFRVDEFKIVLQRGTQKYYRATKHGIEYDPSIPVTKYYSNCFFFIESYSVGVRYIRNEKVVQFSQWTWWIQSYMLSNFEDFRAIPDTTFLIVLAHNAEQKQDTQWTRGTQKSFLAYFQHKKSNDGDTCKIDWILTRNGIDEAWGNSFTLVDKTAELLAIGHWSHTTNIFYFGDILSYGCIDTSSWTYDVDGNPICKRKNLIVSYCAEALPLTKGCRRCADSDEYGQIEMVSAPSYFYPTNKVCRNNSVSCESPLTYSTDMKSYFRCSEISGCSTCWENLRQCKECKPKFGISFANGNCTDCNELKSNCIKCVETRYFNGLCCQECRLGFFVNKNLDCQSCPPKCDKCTNRTHCVQCQHGYKLNDLGDTTSCTTSCRADQFLNSEGSCQSCSHKDNPNCLECDNIDVCQKCKDGTQMNLKGICGSGCEADQFSTGDIREPCKLCKDVFENGGCNRCKDKSGECTGCLDGYSIDEFKYCRKDCDVGQYWLGTQSNRCSSCSRDENNFACLQCKDETGVCTKCKEGYRVSLKGDCNIECGQGKYLADDQKSCRKCTEVGSGNPHCLECSDGSGDCLKCRSDLFLLKNSSCLEKCPLSTQFKKLLDSDSEVKRYDCLSCKEVDNNQECVECEELTGKCIRCSSGFSLDSNNYCRVDCRKDQYWGGQDDNSCQNCSLKTKHCSKCKNINGSCLECSSGYKLLNNSFCKKICESDEYWTGTSNNTCISCHDSLKGGKACMECSELSGNCTSCKNSYFLSSEGYCQAKCSEVEYWTGKELNKCSECDPESSVCLKCTNQTGMCESCESGYWARDKTCYRRCRSDKYLDFKNKKCLSCGAHCMKCQNNTGTCLECEEGYIESSGKENKECSKPEEVREKRGIDEGIPQLIFLYFDKLTVSVNMIFDMKVSKNKVPKVFKSLRITLIENKQNFILKVKQVVFEERLKRMKMIIDFPLDEINQAVLQIEGELSKEMESKDQSARRLMQKQSENGKKEDPKARATIVNLRLRKLAENEPQEPQKISKKIEKVSYFKETNLGIFISISIILGAISHIMSLLILLVSSQMAVVVIQTIQIIKMMLMLEISLPTNLLTFMIQFQKSILTLAPSPLSLNQNITRCKVSPALTKQGLSCIAFNSVGITLVLWVMLLVLKVIMMAVFYERRRSKFKKYEYLRELRVKRSLKSLKERMILVFDGFNDFISAKFIWVLLQSSTMEIAFAALTSIKYGDGFSTMMGMDQSISYSIVVILVLTLTVVVSLSIRNWLKVKKNLKDTNKATEVETKAQSSIPKRPRSSARNCFHQSARLITATTSEVFKTSKPSSVLIAPLNLLLGLIIPFFVVFSSDSASTQASPCSTCLLISALLLIATRPYKKALVTWSQVGVFAVLFFIFYRLGSGDQEINSEREKYSQVGTVGFIILSVLVMALNVLGGIGISQGIENWKEKGRLEILRLRNKIEIAEEKEGYTGGGVAKDTEAGLGSRVPIRSSKGKIVVNNNAIAQSNLFMSEEKRAKGLGLRALSSREGMDQPKFGSNAQEIRGTSSIFQFGGEGVGQKSVEVGEAVGPNNQKL